MLSLTPKELKSYEKANRCYICGIIFFKRSSNTINCRKVRDHCHYTGKYRGATYSICNLKFNVPNGTPEAFHRGSKYDFHLIIKELANEFDCQFDCIAKNSEKYKTFFIPINKEVVKIDKEGNKTSEFILSKIKFIDNMRFVATSISNLADDLTGGIHKLNCKNYNCFPEYKHVKSSLIEYNCPSCNKDFSVELDEELKKKLKNTFEFSKHDTNKFILLLRTGIYPYKYMDDWVKFNKEALPEK